MKLQSEYIKTSEFNTIKVDIKPQKLKNWPGLVQNYPN